jgi:uncharacterized membrane protein required for colicin V production
LGGVWRGFIRTVLGFANFILAIFLTNMLYPHVGRFLRGAGGLFDSLTTSISRMLNIEAILEERAGAAYYQIIGDLPLPQAFQATLIENYPDALVHYALGTTGISDYIAGFLAGIVINIISLVLTFVIIFALLVAITRVLNVVAKLPVLNTLNKLLGGVLGAAWGLILTWFVLGIIVIYFAANSGADMVAMLEGSAIARPLHEANPIVNFILRIFP